MIAVLVAAGMALLAALVGTPILIGFLHREGIGQQIREDGPTGHITKAGTPTMGGIAIVGAAVVGYLAGHIPHGAITTTSGLLAMACVVGAGGVGFLDDFIKVSRRRSLGLNKRGKMAGQLGVAIAFALLALHWGGVHTTLSFTRFNYPGIHLGSVGWVLLAIVMIVGSSNAVNLTDGLDGLAAGSATFAFSTFVIIGYWQFRHGPGQTAHAPDIYHVRNALDLALAAAAMAGGCAGFLWWNAAPARIFMGDTGSLAIGAGLAALALEMNLQLLLPVLGGLFVLITLSVIIQVASFRIFHRRVFRMAPLQHHFELGGWPETTVVVRFWILAGLCTAIGIGVFYADFLRLPGAS